MPGVASSGVALDRLQRQGLTLAVVSNSDGTCATSLEDAGLLRYLSVVIDSAEVGVEKPDPRIFEFALVRCGAHPRRTLHIGDLYQRGCRQGARRRPARTAPRPVRRLAADGLRAGGGSVGGCGQSGVGWRAPLVQEPGAILKRCGATRPPLSVPRAPVV